MARTQTVMLGGHWNDFVASRVESGRYASVSEVLRESLRLPEEQEAASKLEALRQALIEGEASDPAGPLDMDTFKRRARQEGFNHSTCTGRSFAMRRADGHGYCQTCPGCPVQPAAPGASPTPRRNRGIRAPAADPRRERAWVLPVLVRPRVLTDCSRKQHSVRYAT